VHLYQPYLASHISFISQSLGFPILAKRLIDIKIENPKPNPEFPLLTRQTFAITIYNNGERLPF
jgi:hypothetical protein